MLQDPSHNQDRFEADVLVKFRFEPFENFEIEVGEQKIFRFIIYNDEEKGVILMGIK